MTRAIYTQDLTLSDPLDSAVDRALECLKQKPKDICGLVKEPGYGMVQ